MRWERYIGLRVLARAMAARIASPPTRAMLACNVNDFINNFSDIGTSKVSGPTTPQDSL